jgi:transglycosylase-like protein with SLT domain
VSPGDLTFRSGEPVSPELVLVCPELRELLFDAELEAERDVEPSPEPARRRPRRHLKLVASAATVALALSSGRIDGGSRAVPRSAAPRPASVQVAAAARVPLVSTRAARRLAVVLPVARAVRKKPPAPRPRVVRHAAPVPMQPSEIEPVSAMLGPLPDPTPKRDRLSPATARSILAAASSRRLDWALLTARLRFNSAWPHLRRRSIRLAALRLSRPHDPPDAPLLVTAQYEREVGIDALISGLEGAKAVLGSQVLRDPRITIYAGGQQDIAAGRVDVRVLSTLLFLARRTGQITVSSLVSGHSAPLGGGRSAHQFGAAVEISSLGGRPVAVEQEPGGVVDRAIRALLLLPEEVRPKHVVSLLALGGPTFALADFREHIQVSFDPTIRSAPDQLQVLWQLAGSRYGVPWRVLAAINKIETNDGRNMGPSSAGAIGWMQFMPSTWRAWGVDANGDGRADPANPADAIFAAARYLAAAGAGTDLRRAIYAYNHADWYVDDVLRLAGSYD